MSTVLLTCLLVGSWEFVGGNAPQFGTAVIEVMEVYVCPHPGGPEAHLEEPRPPSTGIRVTRKLHLGDRTFDATAMEFCYVKGKAAESLWECPALRPPYSWDGSH